MLAAAVCSGLAGRRHAIEIVLKDGRVLRGEKGQVAGLADVPSRAIVKGSDPDSGPLQLIVFLDDNLRRTYFLRSPGRARSARRRIGNSTRSSPSASGCFTPARRSEASASRSHVEPFDEFGRRIFTINTARGLVDVVQGITELTPQWTKVEGISHVWDMRIATSSIPRDTLQKILLKQIDPKIGRAL